MVRHAPGPVDLGSPVVAAGQTADDDWVLVGQGTGEDNFIVRLTEEAGSARQNGSLIDSARSQTRALWPERPSLWFWRS